MQSPLMGLFEKNRARKFFGFVGQYDVNNPKTHQGTADRADRPNRRMPRAPGRPRAETRVSPAAAAPLDPQAWTRTRPR